MTADMPEARTFELTNDLVTVGPFGYAPGIDCPGCSDWIRLSNLIGGHTCDCGIDITTDITVSLTAAGGRADSDEDNNTTQTTDP